MYQHNKQPAYKMGKPAVYYISQSLLNTSMLSRFKFMIYISCFSKRDGRSFCPPIRKQAGANSSHNYSSYISNVEKEPSRRYPLFMILISMKCHFMPALLIINDCVCLCRVIPIDRSAQFLRDIAQRHEETILYQYGSAHAVGQGNILR